MKIIYPDYTNSILNVSNSILKHYGITPQYPTLKTLDTALANNYKNVVLIIYDGLGKKILENHLCPNACLNRQTKQIITSIFPPTTAAATTTFYSSLPPIEHGWLGWSLYFKKRKQVIELFSGKEFYTQQQTTLNAWKELPYTSLNDKIETATNGTVKTHKLFPHFINGTIHSIAEQWAQITKLCQNADRNFILSYWAEPDKTMHRKGTKCNTVKQIVHEINDTIERMAAHLSDTIVIISADHGHMDLDGHILINDYPELVDCLACPLSIEDRATAVYLKPGTTEQFIAAFNKYLSNDFILLSKEEVLKRELFGQICDNKNGAKGVDFIGDYLIIATGAKRIIQHIDNMADFPEFKGIHAGLTEAEMLVPLILIEKK